MALAAGTPEGLIAKSLAPWNVGTRDRSMAELPNCWPSGPLEYLAAGLPDCQAALAARLLDCQAAGLLDFQVSWPPAIPNAGHPDVGTVGWLVA